MSLIFDSDKMFKYYIDECLIPACDNIMRDFIADFKSAAKHNKEGKDYDYEKAVYDEATETITATCTFYANAIMESYGKGKEMDKSNEDLQEYMQSELWNKLRTSYEIVGRPKSPPPYTNIYGKSIESKGRYAGKPLGGDMKPNSKKPIQNSIKRLKHSLDRKLEEETNYFFDTTDFSIFFTD